jgi:cardiolipin synthase
MTPAEACLKFVEELPVSLAQYLIQQLRLGAVPSIPNPRYQGRIEDFLRRWEHIRQELPPMLEVALTAKFAMPTTELVWSGPSTSVVPRRATEQVLFDLIQGARQRLTIMSFGVFRIPRLVRSLEEALATGVHLRIVLGDRESNGETDMERQCQELGKIVASSASILRWLPERRLRDEQGHAGLMHAKAAVADSCVAFLTSANLTEAALERNMELGVLVRGGTLPISIDHLLDSLTECGDIQPIR